MFANYPGKRIPESDEILILWAVRIATTIIKKRKIAAEIDGGVPERFQFVRTGDSTIGINVRLIESDARKKTIQGGIAVNSQLLVVIPGPRFVHNIGGEHPRIRNR